MQGRRIGETRNSAEEGITVDAPGVRLGNQASHYARLAILQRDVSSVLAVVDDGNAVVRLRTERAYRQLQFQADVPVAVNNRSGLYGDTQVLILDGRKRRDVAVVADDLSDGGRVVDGRESRIHNRITLPDVQGGEVVLRSPQGHVFQV